MKPQRTTFVAYVNPSGWLEIPQQFVKVGKDWYELREQDAFRHQGPVTRKTRKIWKYGPLGCYPEPLKPKPKKQPPIELTFGDDNKPKLAR